MCDCRVYEGWLLWAHAHAGSVSAILVGRCPRTEHNLQLRVLLYWTPYIKTTPFPYSHADRPDAASALYELERHPHQSAKKYPTDRHGCGVVADM